MLVVLIYQWSGESVVALILALVTLFAGLALFEWRPWAPEQASPLFGRPATRRVADDGIDRGGPESDRYDGSGDPFGDAADGAGQANGSGLDGPAGVGLDPARWAPPPEPLVHRPPGGDVAWRHDVDIRWDDAGLAGLPLGRVRPEAWPWTSVAGLSTEWRRARQTSNRIEERVALVVRLDRGAGGQAPAPELALVFGRDQDPAVVLAEAGAIHRRVRATTSWVGRLSPAERTRKLATTLSPTPVTLTSQIRSPELLYQELRRALLTGRAMRRLSADAEAAQITDAVGVLFDAHRVLPLSAAELDAIGTELAVADGPWPTVLYPTIDGAAAQRNLRLAFLDNGTEDHLIALLPRHEADEWDGQTIGSGLTTVILGPPPDGGPQTTS